MKRAGVLFFTFTLPLSALGAPAGDPKNGRFEVPGVGLVRVQHTVVGEPIAQPERVEVFVTCKGAKAPVRVAIFRMCIFDGYTYEAGTKTLSFNMKYGRVEPKTGDVICDQFDMRPVELAHACDNLKR